MTGAEATGICIPAVVCRYVCVLCNPASSLAAHVSGQHSFIGRYSPCNIACTTTASCYVCATAGSLGLALIECIAHLSNRTTEDSGCQTNDSPVHFVSSKLQHLEDQYMMRAQLERVKPQHAMEEQMARYKQVSTQQPGKPGQWHHHFWQTALQHHVAVTIPCCCGCLQSEYAVHSVVRPWQCCMPL